MQIEPHPNAAKNTPKMLGPQTAKNANSVDFGNFLSLLTTQLKNQDPLEPEKSTDFIAQLANFSSVEQEVKMNEFLSQISQTLGANPINSLASWVGQKVLPGGRVAFRGSPLEIETNISNSEKQAVLIVRDSSGNEVQRIDLAPGTKKISWEGKTQTGGTLPSGEYDLSVEVSSEGKIVSHQPAGTFSRVVEARLDGDKTVLVLENGINAKASAVTAVR